jgi:hypothetical protein
MKNIIWILLLLFILAGLVNAQGYGWNYENRTTTTVKDSMAWANAALTLYYQVHPQVTLRDTLPRASSRFWSGKGSVNKRTKLLNIATAQLDSTTRYAIIKSDSLLMGSWMRWIVTDGTNTDTSQAVPIKRAERYQVFYYFDDVSTNLIRQFLLLLIQ